MGKFELEIYKDPANRVPLLVDGDSVLVLDFETAKAFIVVHAFSRLGLIIKSIEVTGKITDH